MNLNNSDALALETKLGPKLLCPLPAPSLQVSSLLRKERLVLAAQAGCT